MAVLIVATDADDHAQAVAGHIARLGGEAEIVDLSLFPRSARLAARYECCADCGGRRFTLTLPGERRLDLGEFGAAWWRRPQHPVVAPEIVSQSHRMFATSEAHEALSGLWHALDAFWVNDPARDEVAHRKAHQLRVAHDAELRIPHTLITNDPDEARAFLDAHGYRAVYKAFTGTYEQWRETRLVRPDELSLLDNVRYAPVIFQEYVEAVYDLRVTVVGDRVFAAAIHSQETEYPVDFRMDIANARIEPAELPDDVVAQLRDLMARLGLVYGAIDMRLTPEGRHVFLEINPAGQWLFVEDATGQPMAAALAELLLGRDQSAGSISRAAGMSSGQSVTASSTRTRNGGSPDASV
jgi:glutathione synthase/RimK-type ligase-like ATP-grasp enzyme